MKSIALALSMLVAMLLCLAEAGAAAPRIDSLEMASPQPHESDPAVIWHDDFDGEPKRYTESQNDATADMPFGGKGKSLPTVFAKGTKGTGNRKVFFGDSPTGRVVRKGQSFEDIYWRVYVKHQAGWQGGSPAKLSRATSIVGGNWAQAMIAHVWGSGNSLTLDPASGVRGDQIVTTRYNDFANLRWMGNKPVAQTQLYDDEAGRWVCVESRAKLNTPGQKDGLNQLWIDGRLEAERKNLDWRGSYTKHGINGVFLEAYWNDNSPVDQVRWLDNFVISTEPIGPVVVPRRPVVLLHADDAAATFEVELAADADGKSIVWRQKPAAGLRVAVGGETGEFLGPLTGKTALAPATVHYARVRQQNAGGAWGDWSPWHQPFRTVGE